MGVRAQYPAAVFTSLEKGELWVRQHRLEGVLTWYPLDISAHDWAVSSGRFKPKPHRQTQHFLAGFTSVGQPYHHYEFAGAPENVRED